MKLFLSIILIFLICTVVIAGNRTMQSYDLTKSFEGCQRLKNGIVYAYPDVVHGWKVATIGYGSTKGVYRGMQITKDQAEELLKFDMKRFERHVNSINAKLNQNQFDALTDHAFNIGSVYGGLRIAVESGYHKLAAEKLKLYVYANGIKLNGLVRRTNARARLYLKPECNE